MKTMKPIFIFFFLVLMSCSISHANDFKPLNFSVWTDYKKIDFENLTPDEKTTKLQALFMDKVRFCKKHGIRRTIIRVLDPSSFSFFNPENFDSTRDDNFYFWAIELSKCAELEVVFDPSSFNLYPSSLCNSLSNLAKAFFKVQSPYQDFQHLVEKLSWVSLVNDMYDPSFSNPPLIRGVTINPKGISDQLFQRVINALDQYRCSASTEFPPNNFPSLRTAAYFDLDQRDLAFANLARFPLATDLRTERPGDLGITLTDTFSAQGEELLAPEWRPDDNRPLLDHAYVNMANRRLISAIYQNQAYVAKPEVYDEKGILTCSRHLAMNLRGEPIAKGPGTVTILKGTNVVSGTYTFFRTGDLKNREGKFVRNSVIEITPPHIETTMRKVISDHPGTNKEMHVTSSFSTTADIIDAKYRFTPTPISWNRPMISNALSSRIYFVFSCEFTPPKDLFMGNWRDQNFITFLKSKDNNAGFLLHPIFTNLSNQGQNPSNNIVLYDFTTIPNGTPYPEINWGLGNAVHR